MCYFAIKLIILIIKQKYLDCLDTIQIDVTLDLGMKRSKLFSNEVFERNHEKKINF